MKNRKSLKTLENLLTFATALLVVTATAIVRDRSFLGNDISGAATTKTVDNDTLHTLADGTMVVSTAALAKDVSGFGGPVPLNVYVKDGKVVKIEALPNSETPEFFGKASAILSRWNGKNIEEAVKMQVDGVSGATFSSKAIIENARRGLAFAAKTNDPADTGGNKWPDAKGLAALAVVLLGAVLPIWVKSRRYHMVQLALNVGVLGLWCGTFVSHSLLTRIASHGITITASLAPLAMLAVAFVYPLFGRKSHYCAHICPLGSAQELASHARHRKMQLSASTVQRITTVRRLLWGVLTALALTGVWSGWMDYELFTAFLFNAASWVVVAFAAVVLVLSVFVPRPYCRFLCPTGTLLKFAQGSE